MVVPEQQQVAVAPPQLGAERTRGAAAARAAESAAPPARAAGAPQRDQVAPNAIDKLAAAAREAGSAPIASDARRATEGREGRRAVDARATGARGRRGAAPLRRPQRAATAGARRRGTAEERASAFADVIEIPTLDPSLGGASLAIASSAPTTAAHVDGEASDRSDGIVAGSAPSNSVCWFVGRAGLVLLTTDAGATFTNVSLAEPLDLASVTATDARNATVYYRQRPPLPHRRRRPHLAAVLGLNSPSCKKLPPHRSKGKGRSPARFQGAVLRCPHALCSSVALVAGALVLARPDAHSLFAGAEPETTPPANESQSGSGPHDDARPIRPSCRSPSTTPTSRWCAMSATCSSRAAPATCASWTSPRPSIRRRCISDRSPSRRKSACSSRTTNTICSIPTSCCASTSAAR